MGGNVPDDSFIGLFEAILVQKEVHQLILNPLEQEEVCQSERAQHWGVYWSSRVLEQLGAGAAGCWSSRVLEQLGAGAAGCWSSRVLEQLDVGAAGYWSSRVLEQLGAGAAVCWSIWALEQLGAGAAGRLSSWVLEQLYAQIDDPLIDNDGSVDGQRLNVRRGLRQPSS